MNCPQCGAEYTLEKVSVKNDKINEYGRREITILAFGQSWIKWDSKKKEYSCLKCGHHFSFQEAVAQ